MSGRSRHYEAQCVGQKNISPRFARLDVRGVDAGVSEPGEDRVADELRTVVGAQETRCAVLGDESGQNLDHAARANGSGHVDRQAFAGELIDHRQALDLLAARAGVEREVVGPDVVCVEGSPIFPSCVN